MNWEIYINSFGNLSRLDVEEGPVLVYQAKDFTQIEENRISYSQELRLPKSPNNLRLLGLINDLNILVETPYEAIPCHIYYKGIDILNEPAHIEILTVGDTINCQVKSSLKSVFDDMKQIDMGSTYYPGVDTVDWTIEDYAEARDGGRDYFYGMAALGILDTIRGHQSVGLLYHTLNPQIGLTGIVPLSYLRPYIPIIKTARKVFEHHGYQLTTDIDEIDGELFLSLTELRARDNSFTMLNRSIMGTHYVYEARFPQSILQSGIVSRFIYDETRNITVMLPQDDPVPDYPNMCVEYTSPGYIRVKFIFEFQTVGQSAYPKFQIRGLDINKHNEEDEQLLYDGGTPFIGAGGTWTEESEYIELSPGERIALEAFLLNGTVGADIGITITAQVDPTSECCAGSRMYPLNSTEFATQYDFIKFFTELYNLSYRINGDIVEAFTFSKVLESDAIDWSDKVDSQSIMSRFKPSGWAQHNVFKFAPNRLLEDGKFIDGNVVDQAFIDIANTNLDATKDKIVYPTETVIEGNTIYRFLNNNHEYQYTSLIPTYVAEENIDYSPSSDFTPNIIGGRVQKISTVSRKHAIVIRAASGAPTTNIIIGYTTNRVASQNSPPVLVRPYPTRLIVDRYYRSLEEILSQYREIEISVNLNEIDLLTLDYTKRIFISRFGHYFSLVKINNFRPGRLTTCVLKMIQ